ncbi:uncharacterized protein B0H64DRAFT_64864 [Chaetomium fimeti]|uniref:Uncharacterized protein n=1 Tax=Chaetomium fimeti TaxID=1854472 RepID=A0AAE0H591_9PEZI|nr:hypothetical protein B0H64DRAFT_64864 [Chaetomium fimeti]
MYHQGGRVETDAPEMAAARGQIAAIQRQHRVQRRHGEQPSQTPTMSGLFRQEQPADVGDGLPPSAQPRQSPAEDDDDNSQASQPQLPRPGPVPSRRPRSSSSQSRGRPRGRPRLGRMPVGRPSTRGRRAAVSAPPRRDFDEPGPRFSGDDQEAPLSSEDIAIKREFDEALAAEDMKRFQAHSARLDDKGRGGPWRCGPGRVMARRLIGGAGDRECPRSTQPIHKMTESAPSGYLGSPSTAGTCHLAAVVDSPSCAWSARESACF